MKIKLKKCLTRNPLVKFVKNQFEHSQFGHQNSRTTPQHLYKELFQKYINRWKNNKERLLRQGKRKVLKLRQYDVSNLSRNSFKSDRSDSD